MAQGISLKVVVRKDNLPKVPAEVERLVAREIEKGARQIEATAKQKAPVRTGTLRRSIHSVISDGGLRATVGPSVEYGIYPEFGTRHMPAHPYMRPAAEQHFPRIVEDVKRALRDAP